RVRKAQRGFPPLVAMARFASIAGLPPLFVAVWNLPEQSRPKIPSNIFERNIPTLLHTPAKSLPPAATRSQSTRKHEIFGERLSATGTIGLLRNHHFAPDSRIGASFLYRSSISRTGSSHPNCATACAAPAFSCLRNSGSDNILRIAS